MKHIKKSQEPETFTKWKGLENDDWKPRDLVDIFGSKGIISEVINGKRSISKSQAKALGTFFHVSPALFL